MRRENIFGFLKDLSGVFVEIGTCWGGFAEWLKQNSSATAIITVDPYRKFKDGYEDALNDMTQEQMDQKFHIVAQRLLPQGIIMVRETSYRASGAIPDCSLSFCYIDGNHSYDAVLKDLVRWWPKIQPGGYLCGDDVEDYHKPHDDQGDLFVEHPGGGYGKYGVHQAIADFSRICPSFRYTLADNQFIARKAL